MMDSYPPCFISLESPFISLSIDELFVMIVSLDVEIGGKVKNEKVPKLIGYLVFHVSHTVHSEYFGF